MFPTDRSSTRDAESSINPTFRRDRSVVHPVKFMLILTQLLGNRHLNPNERECEGKTTESVVLCACVRLMKENLLGQNSSFNDALVCEIPCVGGIRGQNLQMNS